MQANKAIVGRNAFAHEAGIHQDGMLKDRRTYEIMRPEEVGVPQATLVLGKHSGRHAVQRRCEQLGVTLERQELDQVYRGVIAHADREKTVSDKRSDRDHRARPRRSEAPDSLCSRRPRLLDDTRGERLRARGVTVSAVRDPGLGIRKSG